MSIEKNMNTRIQHKHDIEANWNKALNFIPKIGEIIVYDIDDNCNYSRFKIGDGVRTINDLEFLLDTQYILHNSNTLSQILEQYDIKATHYATSGTGASTQAKTATVQNGSFTLEAGTSISIKFTYANTVSSPTLNVNNTGAKSIFFRGAAITSSNYYWAAGSIVTFIYDGTQWNMTGAPADSDTDTKVTQSAAITSSGNYPVLLGYNTSTSAVTDTVNKTATLNYNPSTSALTTGNLVVSSGYGTELPSSGVEGQVFFLVID